MHIARPILALALTVPLGTTDPLTGTTGGLADIGASIVDTTGPDRTLDVRGGVAARAFVVDGVPAAVPGDVFVLMGAPDSPRRVRVFDEHAHTATSAPRPETDRANRTAAWTVGRILGHDVTPVTLTYSDGGGDSGGLAYTISYLNLAVDGGFTGGLRVAATGRVLDGERVREVLAIDEKTIAAHGAGADVVFVPAPPSADVVSTLGARARGARVDDSQTWDEHTEWGASRIDGRVDVITVHHIGDVAAYLCGAGSTAACEVLDQMAEVFGLPTA
jgi:hypothetical protein